MKTLRLLICAAALTATALTSSGMIQLNGTIQFDGTITMVDITSIPWVQGSVMWGAVDTGGMTGIGASGFASLSGIPSFDPTKLTLSYGGLTLTSYLSPTPTAAGYEIYTPGSGAQPFTVSYNGTPWATGSIVFMRTDVVNSAATSAIGSGQAFLTGASTDGMAFFNEVMAQTGGTGLLNISVDGFFPVDYAGHFASTGSVTTAVPEPATYAALFGLAALGLAFRARQRR